MYYNQYYNTYFAFCQYPRARNFRQSDNENSVLHLAAHCYLATIQLVFLNPTCVGYYQPSFFSCVHFNSPLSIRNPLSTNSIYYWGLICQYLWYIILVNTIRSYQWEILSKRLEKFQLPSIGAGVGTNGILVIKMSALVYAPSVKALTGINPISFVGGKYGNDR